MYFTICDGCRMHLRMTPVAKLSQNKNIKELEAKLKKESGALLMDYV